MENNKREKFASRLGFILVSAGCAVGLGNVWKFPYICGINGGAIFIILYLICLCLLGLPILISEFAVGRGSGQSIGKAFRTLEPEGTRWHKFRYFGFAGNYLLMAFYTMVAGWMLNYVYLTATGKLSGLDTDGIEESAFASNMCNVFRKDEVKESFDRDELLKNAPSSNGEAYSLPSMME